MPLGTEVGLGLGDIHIPPKKGGTAVRHFSAQTIAHPMLLLSTCCVSGFKFNQSVFLLRPLRQGGYVFVVVCLLVCLLATSRKKLPNGFA